MADEPLAIAQVTPHAWGTRHEVNEYVDRVSQELAGRGHAVLVVAPSESLEEIRADRVRIREAAADGTPLARPGEVRVLTAGGAIPLPTGGSQAASVSLPIDVNRIVEELLENQQLDICHVHEPYAPSLSHAALRHSRALNVATFHEPQERILTTLLGRPVAELLYGRIDARTTSYVATAELLDRTFPGSRTVVAPGADAPAATRDDGAPHLVYCATEERGALRLFMRALRRLPTDRPWRATIWSDRRDDSAIRLNRALQQRVVVTGGWETTPQELLGTADVMCAASTGVAPDPGMIRSALVAGAVPVVSRLDRYTETVADGTWGRLFTIGDAHLLGDQLRLVLDDEALREELRRAATPAASRSWAVVTDELSDIYRTIAARRHDPEGRLAVRKRLQGRREIECDLHMHTDHSPDCATPARELVETAKEVGLGAIAVTDHNEISGAFEAQEIAREVGGIQVIVGEEVKTAGEGEVIGLFLKSKIERGMSMRATINEIRRQGGVVYMPHPFDRLHSVPDYEHLLEVVEDVDILEVFNPRVTLSSFNDEAVRFAAKYRIIPGAGSDGHVVQALGSVRIRLHDFDGPEEFVQAMRDADIVRKHRNIVYVQALKWLQTQGPTKRARAAKQARAARAQ
ncbi:MAG: PHP domain-containing protein [Solirubrobacterales bacterium]